MKIPPKYSESLQKLLSNQLLSGSFLLFGGTTLASFGNYFYHLLMGRMLGPNDYGVLASLISLAYILSIPITTLNLVVVKEVSSLRGKKKIDLIDSFYSWINKKALLLSLIAFFSLTVFSGPIASFLHLSQKFPLMLVIVATLIGVFPTINLGVIQGFLRFGWMAEVTFLPVLLKVGLAAILVLLGTKVLGATVAILLSAIMGWALSAFFVRKILIGKKVMRQIDGRALVKYALPVLFSGLAFTSFYTSDIILARHYLPQLEAGYYAALALLGKIIFFAGNPVAMVMFPMISERQASGRRYLHLFSRSFILVSLASLAVSAVYFLFPELMVKILFGKAYLPASSQLWLFAVFLSLYSICYLLANFYLSVKDVKPIIFCVGAAVIQVSLLLFFHRDLIQMVLVSIAVIILLLISLLVYYLLNYGQRKDSG